jgi:integrative and conjugative element protein (TIGR02256 family)
LDNTILNGAKVAFIPADVIAPEKHKPVVDAAFEAAELICDFSASISVARFLGDSKSKARHVSVFLTPNGGGLIVAAEDAKRKTRLNWLEMVHYRAVMTETAIRTSLQSSESHVRYGNSCRDLSARLSQDDVAIWSGIASKAIKRIVQQKEAALEIYSFDSTGVRPALCPAITKVRSMRLGDWTVRIDDGTIAKLSKFREQYLPKETGGILLGHFDTHSRVCSIVDVIPSPPDSIAWPTSYIRGVDGLAERVAESEAATLGQIGYVGEWHSHPRGCPTFPSGDDLKAYAWLCDHMNVEALPAVMLIIGDRKSIHLIGSL